MQEKDIEKVTNCITKQWLTILGIIVSAIFYMGIAYSTFNTITSKISEHDSKFEKQEEDITEIKTEISAIKPVMQTTAGDVRDIKRYLFKGK